MGIARFIAGMLTRHSDFWRIRFQQSILCRAGGTMTAVMSAANEKAVEVFLREEISYLDIVPLVAACCEAHKGDLTAAPSIDDIVHFDAWARDWTAAHAKSFSRKPLAVAS